MAGGRDLRALPEVQHLAHGQGVAQASVRSREEQHPVAGAAGAVIRHGVAAGVDRDAACDDIRRCRANEHQPAHGDRAGAAVGSRQRGGRRDRHQAGGFVVGGSRDAVVGATDDDRAATDVLMVRAGGRARLSEGQRRCAGPGVRERLGLRCARGGIPGEHQLGEHQLPSARAADSAAQAVGAEADHVNLGDALPNDRVGAGGGAGDVEDCPAGGSGHRERVSGQARRSDEIGGACRQWCWQCSLAGREHDLIVGAQPMADTGECVGGGINRDRPLNAGRAVAGDARGASEDGPGGVAVGHQPVDAEVAGATTTQVDLAAAFGPNVIGAEGAEERHELCVAVVDDQTAGTAQVHLGIAIHHHRADG